LYIADIASAWHGGNTRSSQFTVAPAHGIAASPTIVIAVVAVVADACARLLLARHFNLLQTCSNTGAAPESPSLLLKASSPRRRSPSPLLPMPARAVLSASF
jgi:hypothetical protein